MPPSDNHHNTESDAYVERVSDLFVRVMQKALTDDLMEELAKGQVTSSLLAAMWHVDQHGTCSVRSVAEGMAVTFSAASQLVDRLVKRGLANRGAHGSRSATAARRRARGIHPLDSPRRGIPRPHLPRLRPRAHLRLRDRGIASGPVYHRSPTHGTTKIVPRLSPQSIFRTITPHRPPC